MMNKLLLGTGVLAVISASLAMAGPAERRAKALAAYQPAGAAVSCLHLTQIRSSNVIDDRTIDFKVGNKVYRNILPHSCPSLASEERFSYRTSLSQLCSVDTIRVLHSYGGHLQEGAGCGLGKFQPMEKVTQ
jgi:hypothetical protein